MSPRLRLAAMTIACLAAVLLAPAVAGAQGTGFQTPNRAFHKSTVFPLEGQHLAVPCASCHVNGEMKGTPTACVDCHWIRRRDDRYETRLGTDCQSCHSPVTWLATSFDHGTRTGLPLGGAHRQLACEGCHENGRFQGTSPQCITCHREDFQRAQAPDHVAAGFPTDCTACHPASAASFSGARFDHSGFPLVGPHATQACASCHVNGVYQGTPRDCIGCHRPDYERTQNPNHAAAGFPTTCESCHRPTDQTWQSGTGFDHNSVFALVGTHATQACASCHVNNVYRGTPRDCIGCHRPDYERTQNPNHAAAGFPTTCETCHRATDQTWQNGTGFDHNSVFALVGTHATQACASCHVNGVYRGTPRDCIGCHRPDYERTQNPNHVAAGFPTTCESCHRPTDGQWESGGFDHAGVFALNGSHAAAACASCHANNVFAGTPRDCVACHQADYQRTTNPNHAAAGYATACEACHRSGGPGWQGAQVNHDQFWPLAGLHATANCATCHTNGQYRGTPRTCVPCHEAQYRQAQNPNHQAAGLPTTCDQCHRTGGPGWNGASFDHNRFFALVGRHTTAACATCHPSGRYQGTPRECSGCHLPEYQATRDPNHAAAGFPTACETCHRNTDSSWGEGRFTHTWFPITSGRHAVECARCHIDSGNYRVFSCLTGCHPRSEMDREHRNRSGYRYESVACYSCHPDGRD